MDSQPEKLTQTDADGRVVWEGYEPTESEFTERLMDRFEQETVNGFGAISEKLSESDAYTLLARRTGKRRPGQPRAEAPLRQTSYPYRSSAAPDSASCKQGVHIWLTGRHKLLDGRAPVDVIREPGGLERVEALVDQLRSGASA